MKKTALFLSSLCMLFSTISCDTQSSEETKMEYKIEGETFKLSTIVDETLDKLIAFEEEHTQENGILNEYLVDNDSINIKAISSKVKELKN